MKLQLLPRRESEPRNGGERGRDAHKDVLRYITVNKQLDRQREGRTFRREGKEEEKIGLSCARATGTHSIRWAGLGLAFRILMLHTIPGDLEVSNKH